MPPSVLLFSADVVVALVVDVVPPSRELDIKYHELNGDNGVFEQLMASHRVAQVVAPEAIERVVVVAPRTTRAHLRGRFIREAHRCNLSTTTTSWDRLIARGADASCQVKVVLLDPFAVHSNDVDSAISTRMANLRTLPFPPTTPRGAAPHEAHSL